MFDRKACVYLVGHEYQIVFNTDCYGIAWVEVGDEVYPDAQNGLMRSETTVHRATVPAEKLDAAGEYAVCFKPLPERKPYWPVTGELEKQVYRFRPIDWSDGLQIYHLADAHSHVKEAVETASYWGDKLDLLILNGDIPAESKTERDVLAVFDITGGVTGGERPVLYVRGNHDTRGKFALEFTDFIGTDGGRTYFTFRTGSLWGVVLDCGEDKLDGSEEYGGLVCCHPFREAQTAFLKKIVENKANEYDAPGVKTRIAVCHVPFPTNLLEDDPKFDIEKEVYADWTAELNKMGLDVMLCGHMHTRSELLPGDSRLRYSANFPVLTSSEPHFWRENDPKNGLFISAALDISDSEIKADYTDNRGGVSEAMRLKK